MPKIKSPAEKLFDDAIIAQVDMLRLDAGLRKEVLKVLKKLQKDLVRTLTDVDPTAPKLTKWKRARLKKLQQKTDFIIGNAYNEANKRTMKEIRQAARLEYEKTTSNLNRAIGVNIAEVVPNIGVISNLVNNSTIEGKVIGQWWKDKGNDFKKKFSAQMRKTTDLIQLGMTKGQALSEMVKEIKGTSAYPGLFGAEIRNVKAITRTSLMQVANSARQEAYKANDDIIKGVKIVATLDSRTTPICRSLDNLEFSLPDYQPINHAQSFEGGPPYHWNCRTTTVPILFSFAELAGPKSKLSKSQLKKLDSLPVGQRAAFDRPVKADMTYSAWLRTQSESIQLRVLGPKRWEMWKANKKMSMIDMVDQRGRPLLVKDLQKKWKVDQKPKKKPAVRPSQRPTERTSPFIPAKSIREVESRLYETYQDAGHDVKINLKGANLENANKLLKSHTRLLNEYKIGPLKSIGLGGRNLGVVESRIKFNEGITQRMKFNRNNISTPNTLTQIFIKNGKSGFHPISRKGLEADQLFYHEFSHTIATNRNKFFINSQEFSNRLGEIRKEYYEEMRDLLNKRINKEITVKQWESRYKKIRISNYADQNIDEFMAEAFTEYYLSPKSKISPYSVRVVELMKEYFGR